MVVESWFFLPSIGSLILTMCTVGNLWILGEKFKCSSDLPNIKYNCTVLFLWQMHWFFKIYFLIDHRCKTYSELIYILKNSPHLLNFLQSALNNCHTRHYFEWHILKLHKDQCVSATLNSKDNIQLQSKWFQWMIWD